MPLSLFARLGIVTFGSILIHGIVLAAPDGEAIFRESIRRDSGYGDFEAKITMDMFSKSGTKIQRQMQISNLESSGDGARTRVLFENPPDVKGTILLSHMHHQAPDEQWIYLPDFKRVKKISGASRTSPIVSSDFSYEDFLSMNPRIEKYTYAKLPTVLFDSLFCFVIDRKPVESGTGYSRQTVWMDTTHYLIRQIQFYGNDGSHFKTLTLNRYQMENGKYWRAREMHMKNLKTGSETILKVSEFQFGNAFNFAAFEPAALNK